MRNKLLLVADLPERSIREIVRSLNNPSLEVTIEQIGEILITVRKRETRRFR